LVEQQNKFILTTLLQIMNRDDRVFNRQQAHVKSTRDQ